MLRYEALRAKLGQFSLFKDKDKLIDRLPDLSFIIMLGLPFGFVHKSIFTLQLLIYLLFVSNY